MGGTTERMLSLAEAAAALHISYSTARRRVDAGQLVADTSNPKRYRIPASALAGLAVVDPRDAELAALRRDVEQLRQEVRQMRLRGWGYNAPQSKSDGASAPNRYTDVPPPMPLESQRRAMQEGNLLAVGAPEVPIWELQDTPRPKKGFQDVIDMLLAHGASNTKTARDWGMRGMPQDSFSGAMAWVLNRKATNSRFHQDIHACLAACRICRSFL